LLYIFVCRDLVEREENFNCDVSDAFLIRFLRAKKYDYEAAFKMLQRYLGIRARREGGSLKPADFLTGFNFGFLIRKVIFI
jgi:hypothetical protein